MQNNFGVKDFVLYVLVFVALVMMGLSMWQDDRRFVQTRLAAEGTGELRTDVIQLSEVIDQQTRTLEEISRRLSTLNASVNTLRQTGVTGSRAPAGTESPVIPGTDAEEFVEEVAELTEDDFVLAEDKRDESWARPGYPVTWPTRYFILTNDPEDLPNFQRGGTITEIFEANTPKITPHTHNDVYNRRIVDDVVCEQLAGLNAETLRLEGWLADAWQYDPEGMWLRVRIDERARFSDGRPVTAEDVRWTFEDFILNPQIEAAATRSTLTSIESVEVIGPKVVEFRFSEPRFSNLSAPLRISILPKHFYSRFTPAQLNSATGLLVGSGPYRLQSLDINNQWTPGNTLTFVRNERYWGRRPPADRLRFTFVSDNVARLTEFENGNGDIMRASPEQLADRARDPQFTSRHNPLYWTNMRSGYGFIAWNTGMRGNRLSPFHDRRVRLAMTHLLDRDRINRDFYEGIAEVATGPFPPTQADQSIEPWPYDMDRARELLAEAGWIDRDGSGRLRNENGEPFVFEFTYSSGSTFAEQLFNYLRDQCAAVGIQCVPRITDWAIMSTITDQRDFDALTMAWSWSSPESDPYQIFHSDQIEGLGDNWIQWSNPKADAVIERARQTLDYDERLEVWREFHQIVHEDQPYTFLLNIPWIRFVNNRIHNVHTYQVGIDKREWFIP